MKEEDIISNLPDLTERALKRWVVDEPLPEEIEEVWDIPIGNYLRPEVEYDEEEETPLEESVETLGIIILLWLIGLTLAVGVLFYLVLAGE